MPEQSEIYTKGCDICDEYWEPTFFCEACSREPDVVTHLRANPYWFGDPDEEELIEVEESVCRATCLNCCSCKRGAP